MKCFVSSSFTILLHFANIMKRHVMMVYLVFGIFGVSTVVAQPSIVKRPVKIAGYEMTELSNGNLQIRESVFEESIFVFRPNSRNGVESTKLGKDSGTELNRGNVKIVNAEIKISNVPSKTSQQGSTDDGVAMDSDVGNKFWHWIIIFTMCCFPYIGYVQRKVGVLFDAEFCVKCAYLFKK